MVKIMSEQCSHCKGTGFLEECRNKYGAPACPVCGGAGTVEQKAKHQIQNGVCVRCGTNEAKIKRYEMACMDDAWLEKNREAIQKAEDTAKRNGASSERRERKDYYCPRCRKYLKSQERFQRTETTTSSGPFIAGHLLGDADFPIVGAQLRNTTTHQVTHCSACGEKALLL